MAKNEEQENKTKDQKERKYPHITGQPPDESTVSLLRELVAHLRQKRSELREEWAQRIKAYPENIFRKRMMR